MSMERAIPTGVRNSMKINFDCLYLIALFSTLAEEITSLTIFMNMQEDDINDLCKKLKLGHRVSLRKTYAQVKLNPSFIA